MLQRLENQLEAWIPARLACLAAYALGVLTVGMKVARVDAWTVEAAGTWILLFAVLTASFARSHLTLARARQLGGEASTELSRAAMSVTLFPFLALLAVFPVL